MSAGVSHDVVIFDIVMNIDNLYSISAVQNEMDSAINEYVYTGESRYIVTGQFRVIDEVCDCRLLFEKLNDTLSASWEMMYSHAKAYYEQHGDLEVPKKHKTEEGYSLGAWLTVQRRVYKGLTYGILTERQKKKLDETGMRWGNISDANWERNFAAAKKYYQDNGNLLVKAQYKTEDGIRLGAWLSNIRTCVSNGREEQLKSITPARKAMLDSIGMIWNVKDFLWEEKYSAAQKFFKEYGHLDVPDNYVLEDGTRLGKWISYTRNQYNGKITGAGKPTQQQTDRLEAIGMSWRSRYDDLWFSIYKEAKKYFAEHGNLDVPTMYKNAEGTQLGRWIVHQREYRKKDKLAAEKMELLDAIGMIWEKPNSWQLRYDIARQYYEEHGNINISQSTVIDGVWIGKWLSEQRKKKEKLSKDQIMLLEQINMRWESRKEG